MWSPQINLYEFVKLKSSVVGMTRYGEVREPASTSIYSLLWLINFTTTCRKLAQNLLAKVLWLNMAHTYSYTGAYIPTHIHINKIYYCLGTCGSVKAFSAHLLSISTFGLPKNAQAVLIHSQRKRKKKKKNNVICLMKSHVSHAPLTHHNRADSPSFNYKYHQMSIIGRHCHHHQQKPASKQQQHC